MPITLRSCYYRLRNIVVFCYWAGPWTAVKATLSRRRGDRMGRLSTRRTRHPIYFRHHSSDLIVIRDVLHEQKSEVRLEKEPAFIIDGGANIGAFSVLMAQRYPGALILAVEPDPDNVEILRRNVAPYPNVRVVEGGVWSRRANLRISNPGAEAFAIKVEELSDSVGGGLPAYGVADLLALADKPSIDLLKLDIEGSELEVFESGTESWLPRVRELLIELHPSMRPRLAEVFWQAVGKRSHRAGRSGEYHHVVFTDAGVHASE